MSQLVIAFIVGQHCSLRESLHRRRSQSSWSSHGRITFFGDLMKFIMIFLICAYSLQPDPFKSPSYAPAIVLSLCLWCTKLCLVSFATVKKTDTNDTQANSGKQDNCLKFFSSGQHPVTSGKYSYEEIDGEVYTGEESTNKKSRQDNTIKFDILRE